MSAYKCENDIISDKVIGVFCINTHILQNM